LPRLNVYLPDDLYDLANQWRGKINLSEICARALREELAAVDSSRIAFNLSKVIRKRSEVEDRLIEKFSLSDAYVVPPSGRLSTRDDLGQFAADYLDRWLCDGARLGIAGGRQTWSVVRNLQPRNLRLRIFALGYGQTDSVALHAHPNTLLTLAWLLYGPRAQAELVGSSRFLEQWQLADPIEALPKYFVIASCSELTSGSPFSELLGEEATESILESGVVGDFAYVFLNDKGEVADTPFKVSVEQSTLSGTTLQALSERADARVILIAGGKEKADIAESALRCRLCNTLIIDVDIAERLLTSPEVVANVD